MAPHLRFFVQVTSSLNFQGEEGSLSMQQSLSYGYKLALSEDLKL